VRVVDFSPQLEGCCVSKKILLCIDDEATGLKIRKTILERNGYAVLTAPDGAEGLALFEREKVNAVIVDFYMPGMDGGKVASEMKRRKPTVPIVLLSAYYSLPDGATDAVDAFITKGDSPEVLLNKISELVQSNPT
jgi:CheY-like chemotaxis protein